MMNRSRMPDDDAAGDNEAAEDNDSVILLHVEPDARSAELLAASAAGLTDGITVRSVDEMGAALDAADAVDCVVTEQRLPDGSGVELVEGIRAADHEVPVVFHTTCRSEDTAAAALAAGADAYFEKRSQRDQYDRIFERLRALVWASGDGGATRRASTTGSVDAGPSSPAAAGTFTSEE